MKLVLLLVCVLAAAYPALNAQIFGGNVRLSGHVTDYTGAPVVNAQVELRNKQTGTVWRTQTDDNGRYAFAAPPGKYDVVVYSQGFKEYTLSDIVLGGGDEKSVDVPLEVGPLTAEVVTVSDSTPEPAKLTWNAWAEPASPDPSFSPVSFLEPGAKNYTLYIDLAALAYGRGPDVFSRDTGARLREWLLTAKVPTVDLKLLVIPDEAYFEPLAPADRVRTLRVNIKRVREVLKDGLPVRREPFDALKKDPNADFSFGRTAVNLRTRDREGSGAVAIALWADGSLPVDELSIPLCVAKDSAAAKSCEEAETLHPSLAGIDPLRAAAQGRAYAMRPDAALHFIQLGERAAIGVFRDNSWPPDRYVQWNLGTNTAGVLNALEKTLLPGFNRGSNDASLLQVGSELHKLLFPSNAKQARADFADFLRAHSKETNPDDPPSIFVRMLSDTNDPPFLVPLGLMAFDLEGKQDFLGFHFRIQMPLQVQDYRPDTRCISNWVVLAPPPNQAGVPPELNDAREGFADWFKKWEFEHIDEMLRFGRWIGDGVEEREPLALFILAHQNSNSLYFADDPRVSAYGIDRRFKTPSVALVNACGSGAPGASSIVEHLNAQGVSAVIATAAEVDGYLAGDFFSVLAESLAEDHHGREYPLGLAHFHALRKLRAKKSRNTDQPVAYGAKVLAYQLLGNGNLRVCPPPLKK